MYRLKEDLTIVEGKDCHCHFKKGDDFFRNHILLNEKNEPVVYMTPVSGDSSEKVIPLELFENVFFKVDSYE